MTIDEATVNHWRAVVSWSDSDIRSLSLELDRNMGGMWPRIVVHAEARPIDGSGVWIAPSVMSDDVYVGAHDFQYSVGIEQHLVKALMSGAVDGLGAREGLEIRITSCGLSVDSAEMVAHHAAQVASALLSDESVRVPDLKKALAACAKKWA